MKSGSKDVVHAVIFDFDNTLVNTQKVITDAYNQIFEDMSKRHGISKKILSSEIEKIETKMVRNVDKTKENYDRGSWFEMLSKNLNMGLSKKQINKYRDKFYSYMLENVEFSEHTESILADIKASGKKVALLTEKDDAIEGFKQHRVEKLSFSRHFDLIVIAGDTIPERKISPIAFSKTVKMLNVSPKNVLMVGDRLDIDVEHGKEVGMRTVLFKSYASSGTGLYKPDYIVSDLREILSIIK